MRFIGNKEKLAPKIYAILQECAIIESSLRESTISNITESTPKGTTKSLGSKSLKPQQSFCDCFAGSASMGRFFKQKGFRIISCDLLYFSYCLQRAYLQDNSLLDFVGLQGFLESFEKNPTAQCHISLVQSTLSLAQSPYDKVLAFLNSLQGKEGFIATHYAPSLSAKNGVERKYFSDSNAAKIDSIRIQIEEWKDTKCITEKEYYLLLATLLESVSLFANVAGVYAAFCKKWDSRAVKPFRLTGLSLDYPLQSSENLCFCGDSLQVLQTLECNSQKLDILYLDPPYNHRQYAPNYHLLETIARYDNPNIKGVAGLRQWQEQKSRFCNVKSAYKELENFAKLKNYKNLVLSYNSEGLMQKEQIEEILKPIGNMCCVEIIYPRFKSNKNNGKKYIKEYVWVLQR
ncbi:DNA adenine methylase [uncultured Helicobacter sp.]|uniref:DNA adenine methylase n=1 Tax=uncultured Helicobacter sp. TaxID=175537 RepID=UPI00374E747C